MRKIEIIFKAKKAHLPLGENIILGLSSKMCKLIFRRSYDRVV